jgi:hypothetical protein
LPSFGVRRAKATDICRRLIRAGAQASDEPCEFEQSLIDVVLPLDQYAMTQCRLAMLANTLADEFFSRYVGFRSRLAHGNGEVGGEVYRKTGRLWFAHSEDSLADDCCQMELSESIGNGGGDFFLAAGMCRDIEYAFDRAVTQFETRIVVRTFVREWRASQNKTANTYVIEITI